MALQSARHQAVLEELTKWWEGSYEDGIGSRVVLVVAPSGWGRLNVLETFRGVIDDIDGPVTLTVSIDSAPLASLEVPVQAPALCRALMTSGVRSRAADLLGLDTAAGKVQLGLAVGGLFLSGPAAALSLLAASLAVTAAGNAWDSSPAGEEGALARAARAVATVSVSVPVVVVIDDADRLDPALAVTMIENLADRVLERPGASGGCGHTRKRAAEGTFLPYQLQTARSCSQGWRRPGHELRITGCPGA